MMRCKWSWRLFLGVLAYLLVCSSAWPQRRSRQADDHNQDDDVYNEIIDERSEEDKMSPAERQAKLIEKMGEQLRAIRDQKSRESKGKEPREAPPVRNRSERRGTQPAKAGSATTVTGADAKQPAELENRPTLGIVPPWTTISVDQENVFEIRLDNPNKVPYTMVSFAIQYDRTALEVIDQSDELPGVNILDASAADLGLAVEPSNRYYRNEVDGSKGLILFRAAVPTGHSYTNDDGVIARFSVRGLRERGGTSLKFVQMLKGKEIDEILKADLRQPGTFLRMLDDDVREKLLEYSVLNFGAQLKILPSLEGGLAEGDLDYYSTALRVEPSLAQVKVGERFDVLVHLDNPDRVPFDAVALYLRYDPRALRVVDVDEDNWITDGINIGDGEFHDDFQFEYCRANEVNTERGEILYAMESFGEPVSANGPFARIRFVALRPVQSTYLLYGFNVPGRFPTTGVFRRQKDLLAQTNDYRDGVYRGRISIAP